MGEELTSAACRQEGEARLPHLVPRRVPLERQRECRAEQGQGAGACCRGLPRMRHRAQRLWAA